MRLAEEAREAGEEIGVLRAQKRFSHELHDTLAQNFQSIVRTLSTVLRSVPPHEEQDGVAPEGERRPVELALSMAREGAEEARRMIWALRTMPSGPHALGEALKKLVERWSEEAGVEGHLVAAGDPCLLLPDAKVTLFRVAQEALNNVRKHARASRAEITLSYTEELVALHVRDDGRGFDTALSPEAVPEPGPRSKGGFGLHGMRERVEQLGGTLLLDSAPEQGTTLTVVLPVTASGEDLSEDGGGLAEQSQGETKT